MKVLTILLFLVVALSGCAGAIGHGVGASIYNNSNGPGMITASAKGTKQGKSCATGILGFGFGSATVEKAMEEGGISTPTHVDFDSVTILGVYAKTCTVVYGN